MSIGVAVDYGYKITCTFCATVRVAFVAFLIGTIAMFENAGRARAASELARMGRMDEAKALMMEIKNARKN
jgi:hypothetical protein